MWLYLLKRLLLLIPTFFGITLITFLIIKLAPGDPVSLKVAFNEGVKAEVLAHQAESGQDPITLPHWMTSALSPLPDRVKQVSEWFFKNVVYYGQWVRQIIAFDFGLSSKDGRPVLSRILEALPVTLLLNVITLVIVYTVSIPIGVLSALRRDKIEDKAMMVVLFVLYSMPSFWIGMLLLMFFASGEYFDWFPLVGLSSDGSALWPLGARVTDVMWHLVLPVICLTYGSFAFLSRFSRTTFLEVARQD